MSLSLFQQNNIRVIFRAGCPGCNTYYSHANYGDLTHGVGELVGSRYLICRCGSLVSRKNSEITPVKRRVVPPPSLPRLDSDYWNYPGDSDDY